MLGCFSSAFMALISDDSMARALGGALNWCSTKGGLRGRVAVGDTGQGVSKSQHSWADPGS